MANSGKQGYNTLLKVSDDGNNSPLDVNNMLCSITGLPQATKSNTSGSEGYIAPFPNTTACPITLPTFTPTWIGYEATAYCETQDIVIGDFDFLVARFMWDYPQNGKDLDIQVQYENNGISAVDGQYVGYGGLQNVPSTVTGSDSYLWWALDDTNSSGAPLGIEGVNININKFVADYPSTPEITQIGFYTVWYNTVGTGNFTLEVVTYKGGTMSKVGTNMVNTGGTIVSSDSRSLNTTILNQLHTPTSSFKAGTLQYNKTTKTAVLVI